MQGRFEIYIYWLFSWRCPAPPRAQSRIRGPLLLLAATTKLAVARPKVRPDDNAGPGGSMQLDLLVRRARWAAWSGSLPLDGVDQQPESRRVGCPPPHLGLTSVTRCLSQIIYGRTCGASTRSLCRRHLTRRRLTVQRAAQKQRVRPRVQRMLQRAYNRARRRGGSAAALPIGVRVPVLADQVSSAVVPQLSCGTISHQKCGAWARMGEARRAQARGGPLCSTSRACSRRRRIRSTPPTQCST
jgi:hypothetical protein